MVKQSVANGYQGLFALKAVNGTGPPVRRTRFEELTAGAGPEAHEDQGFG